MNRRGDWRLLLSQTGRFRRTECSSLAPPRERKAARHCSGSWRSTRTTTHRFPTVKVRKQPGPAARRGSGLERAGPLRYNRTDCRGAQASSWLPRRSRHVQLASAHIVARLAVSSVSKEWNSKCFCLVPGMSYIGGMLLMQMKEEVGDASTLERTKLLFRTLNFR